MKLSQLHDYNMTIIYSMQSIGYGYLRIDSEIRCGLCEDRVACRVQSESFQGVGRAGSRCESRECGRKEYGAEGQNRTADTSLFRAVLCQLSYLGTKSDHYGKGVMLSLSKQQRHSV